MAAPTVSASDALLRAQFSPGGRGPHLPIPAAMLVPFVEAELAKVDVAALREAHGTRHLMMLNIFSNVRAAFVEAPTGAKLRRKIETGFVSCADDRIVLHRWMWHHAFEAPKAEWLDVALREAPRGGWEIVYIIPQMEPVPLPRTLDRASTPESLGFAARFVEMRTMVLAGPDGGEPVFLWTREDSERESKRLGKPVDDLEPLVSASTAAAIKAGVEALNCIVGAPKPEKAKPKPEDGAGKGKGKGKRGKGKAADAKA